MAIEMQGVAMAAAGTGDAQRALVLGGAAAAELDALGIDFSGIRFWSGLLDRYYGFARSALGDGADAAWQTGRALGFARAVAEALRG